MSFGESCNLTFVLECMRSFRLSRKRASFGAMPQTGNPTSPHAMFCRPHPVFHHTPDFVNSRMALFVWQRVCCLRNGAHWVGFSGAVILRAMSGRTRDERGSEGAVGALSAAELCLPRGHTFVLITCRMQGLLCELCTSKGPFILLRFDASLPGRLCRALILSQSHQDEEV